MMSYFAVQLSALGLKKKKIVLFFSFITPDSCLLLKGSRPLPVPRGPQTSYQPT